MNLMNAATKALDYLSDSNGGNNSKFSNKIKKAYSTNFDLAGTFEVETFMCNAQLTGFLDGVQNDFSGIRSSLSDGISGVAGGLIDGAVNTVSNAIGGVVDKVTGAVSNIVGAVKGVVGGVLDKVGNVANTILGIVGLDALASPIQDLAKKLTGQKININSDVELMSILIKSVSVQQINSADLQEYMGGGWTNSIGRHELSLVTFTLYDVNGAYIYNLFKGVYANLKFAYPDDQKWTLKVKKKTFFESVRGTQQSGGYVINTNNAVLMSIGDYTVSQDNPGLVTFDVQFKYDPFPNE